MCYVTVDSSFSPILATHLLKRLLPPPPLRARKLLSGQLPCSDSAACQKKPKVQLEKKQQLQASAAFEKSHCCVKAFQFL